MIDTDGLLLDPIYSVHGAQAALKLSKDLTLALRVLDLSAGTEIAMNGFDIPVVKAAALLRVSEFEAGGGETAKLKGSVLTIGAKSYDVTNYQRKPMAGGGGEIMLILSDGDA